MSTRVTAFFGIGVLALAIGSAGCEFIDDIIDGIHDPGPGPAPKACASSADCAAGSFCTVESGVCNPPPGCKRGDVCPAVCYGTCEVKAPPPAQCRGDADCRAFAFMCTGCDCLALGPNDREPICDGPGVQCLVDPCLNKKAACDSGRCVIVTGSSCGAGTVPRRVCIACGPAGGCEQETDCARVCKQDSDCGVNQTRCLDGLCQVQGCI
jgi:hypothetical protein